MNELKELVRERVDLEWDAWAARHPHLAAAIDRVRLTDAAVDELRRDPAYVEAMRQAALDEGRLLAAARIVAMVERIVQAGMRP